MHASIHTYLPTYVHTYIHTLCLIHSMNTYLNIYLYIKDDWGLTFRNLRQLNHYLLYLLVLNPPGWRSFTRGDGRIFRSKQSNVHSLKLTVRPRKLMVGRYTTFLLGVCIFRGELLIFQGVIIRNYIIYIKLMFYLVVPPCTIIFSTTRGPLTLALSCQFVSTPMI